MSKCLWKPTEQRVNNSLMKSFLDKIDKKNQLKESSYQALHEWSITNPGDFWTEIIQFFPVNYTGELSPSMGNTKFLNYDWFPNVRINFAENLLRVNSQKNAIRFVHESGINETISYSALRNSVSDFQASIKDIVTKGDVVAAYMPNIPETVVAMLAASALGAVFTSTSADFGVQGVVDRFGQTKPKVLVTVAGYSYNGKYFDQSEKVNEILKKIPSIERVFVVDFLGKGHAINHNDLINWNDIGKSNEDIYFEKMNFKDPLYIMYSSGTTGKPKCIVHGIGGTLLQHIKELGLHCDLTESKSIFYFTTCGWMMWNWLVSSLFFGAEVVLYEGSPGYPSLSGFLKIVDENKINIFGTSPKFLRALEVSGESIDYKFENLETMLSTGAPLLPEQFDYVYQNFKSDLQLSSISGGTDIIGCFMLGNPILNVYRGEIQCLGLGMNVVAYGENQNPVFEREGELVCETPFVSTPIYFWNDRNQEKYKSAYFDEFEGVWHHGDFVTITDRKTVLVHGRSDATLNPGGVRIGTAEIYRQTEKLDYIEDSLCVGKQADGDVDVVLFVKMKDGQNLTSERIKEIQNVIKSHTTPRHVPKNVFEVSGIPYTMSGKKMEKAITRIINKKPLDNIEAVSNPECLKDYENI